MILLKDSRPVHFETEKGRERGGGSREQPKARDTSEILLLAAFQTRGSSQVGFQEKILAVPFGFFVWFFFFFLGGGGLLGGGWCRRVDKFSLIADLT